MYRGVTDHKNTLGSGVFGAWPRISMVVSGALGKQGGRAQAAAPDADTVVLSIIVLAVVRCQFGHLPHVLREQL